MERSCNNSSSIISPNDCDQNINEDCLQFLQGIIQLKSAIKIGNSLPLNEFKDIVLEFPHQCKSSLTNNSLISEEESESRTQCSSSQDVYDSGIGSSASNNNTSEHVSSTTILYLIRSSPVAKYLHDSVISVTNYLFTCLFAGNDQLIEKHILNWRGSLIEEAVNVLVELVDLVCTTEDQEYFKTCSDFIIKAIESIFHSKNVTMYSVLEYQCVIVSELSNSNCLCEIAIHCIMKKIEDMSLKLKGSGLSPQTLQTIEEAVIASDEYDTSVFVLDLLERLLKKWCEHCVTLTLTDQYKKTSFINITEMWKRSWGNSENSDNGRTMMKTLQEKWLHILEEAMQNSMDESPNFSFLTWTCFQILESLDSKI